MADDTTAKDPNLVVGNVTPMTPGNQIWGDPNGGGIGGGGGGWVGGMPTTLDDIRTQVAELKVQMLVLMAEIKEIRTLMSGIDLDKLAKVIERMDKLTRAHPGIFLDEEL